MKFANEKEFNKANAFGKGFENTMFAKYFTGNSYLNPLVKPGQAPLFIANVTFEPGCRNFWHVHRAKSGGGQMLICTAGEGWYQEEGKEAVHLKEGSFILIPPNVKHWHGAASASWFSHIAIEVPGEETANEWCDPVTDEHYKAINNKVIWRIHNMMLEETYTLSNGVKIPKLGLGTWFISDKDAPEAVRQAVKAGPAHRHRAGLYERIWCWRRHPHKRRRERRTVCHQQDCCGSKVLCRRKASH